MNFIAILKKAFMDNWTGGASIDPRTGEQGDPNRYHGRGSFDDFELRDMLRQNRWITEEKVDRNPKSGSPEYTSYYHPRSTGAKLREHGMEGQRDPYASDPRLPGKFQDWPGVNPQGRPYDINPNPEGRNPDGPAHRFHPGAAGAYNPAAGQQARANHRPPQVRGPLAGSLYESASPHRDRLLYIDPQGRQHRQTPLGAPLSSAPFGKYGEFLPENTTRTIVQSKDGTKETTVTKTPNPEVSMMEIMRKIREFEEERAR